MSQSANDEIISKLPMDTLASFHAHKFVETLREGQSETIKQTIKLDTPGRGPGRDSDPLPPGVSASIDGGFKLEKIIGQGGHGEVWDAEQPSLGRRVAIKKIRRDIYRKYAKDPSRVHWYETNFRLEAIATARLEHPNIVPVHAFEEDADGQLLLAMKLVKGRSWHEMLEEEFEKSPVADYLAKHLPILVDVTQAVAFAHAQGIVHRDLKPGQVMIGEFGEVALMDWGIAVAIKSPQLSVDIPSDFIRGLPTPATASSPGGTLAFMAPEQTEQSAIRVGAWTDVYLLGGILYMILTGRPPHPGESREAAFFQACTGAVHDPSSLNPTRVIPQELAEIAMRALRPAPDDRYASAAEFLDELNDFMTGATKRRGSSAMVAEVRACLEEKTLDYSSMTELLAKLDQAKILWAENVEIRDVRTHLLSLQANLAISNGDLVLASATLNRIEDRAVLLGLQPKLDHARAMQEGQRRQRRLGIAASLILATLLAGGSYFAYRQASSDRDSIRAARGASEDLVRFMMKDLRERLAPIDPDLKMLGPAADKVVEHYLAQDIDSLSAPELGELIDGLGDAASILSVQGNSPGALRALEARDRIIDRAEERFPGERRWVQAWLSNAIQSTTIHYVRGNPELAVKVIQQAEAKSDKYFKAHPEDENVAEYRQSLRTEYSQYLSLVGETDKALAELESTVRFWTARPSSGPGSLSRASNLAAAYSRLGLVQGSLGQTDEAGESFAKSLELYREYARTSKDPRRNYVVAVALINLASHEEFLGRVPAADSYLQEAGELLTASLETYGSNAETAQALHTVLTQIAEFAQKRGEFEIADDLYQRDSALIQTYIDRDPNNLTWRRALWVTWASITELEQARGNPEKAFEYSAKIQADTSQALLRMPMNETIICDRISQATGMANLIDIEDAEMRSKARDRLSEAIELGESIHETAADRLNMSRELGIAYAQLGRIYIRNGDLERGSAAYYKSLEFAREIATQGGKSYHNTRDLAVSEFRLAGLLMKQLRIAESVKVMKGAATTFDQIAAEYPEISPSRGEAAALRSTLGVFQLVAGELEDAENSFNTAWEGAERANREGKLVGEFLRNSHADMPTYRARTLQLSGRASLAAELEEEGIRLAEKFLADFPSSSSSKDTVARAHLTRGNGRLLRGDAKGALDEALHAAPGVGEGELATAQADAHQVSLLLMLANQLAAQALAADDRTDESKPHAARAVELAKRLLALRPGEIQLTDRLDCCVVLGLFEPESLPPFGAELLAAGVRRPDLLPFLTGTPSL
jgi:serine/threonine protein kinase/tetratricopeptide (TPR) repeat protein